MNNHEDNSPRICDYEGSTYQETFWDQGTRDYEDKVEAVALKRLLPGSGSLMLEIGAGAGRNTPRYAGYDRIVVTDYSVTQLQQAQQRLGKSDKYIYVAANVYDMPFIDSLFDGATMIRVIHHLAEGEKALAEIYRMMGPAGTFILEYANKMNLKAIARYLLRKQSWSPFNPDPVEFVELNFNFHPKTTRKWLKNAGFTIEKQLTVSHFRIDALKKLFPTSLLVTLDSFAQYTGDLWQLSPSVFVKSVVSPSKPKQANGFFRCIRCGGTTFEETSDTLHCESCSHDWTIVDGIYVFK